MSQFSCTTRKMSENHVSDLPGTCISYVFCIGRWVLLPPAAPGKPRIAFSLNQLSESSTFVLTRFWEVFKLLGKWNPLKCIAFSLQKWYLRLLCHCTKCRNLRDCHCQSPGHIFDVPLLLPVSSNSMNFPLHFNISGMPLLSWLIRSIGVIFILSDEQGISLILSCCLLLWNGLSL